MMRIISHKKKKVKQFILVNNANNKPNTKSPDRKVRTYALCVRKEARHTPQPSVQMDVEPLKHQTINFGENSRG
jgi:hypothetical protein